MFKKEVEEELCPFSWIQQEKGCFASSKVWEPVACLKQRCKLWNKEKSDCNFNVNSGKK